MQDKTKKYNYKKKGKIMIEYIILILLLWGSSVELQAENQKSNFILPQGEISELLQRYCEVCAEEQKLELLKKSLASKHEKFADKLRRARDSGGSNVFHVIVQKLSKTNNVQEAHTLAKVALALIKAISQDLPKEKNHRGETALQLLQKEINKYCNENSDTFDLRICKQLLIFKEIFQSQIIK